MLEIIIDTDAGQDDLMAIAFMLCRKDVSIKAITVVHGLAHALTGAQNIYKLLHLAGRQDIPVYVGADGPLEGDRVFPLRWRHIADHLPGIRIPAVLYTPPKVSAIEYLAGQFKSPAEILALGPLTNIAMAIERTGDVHDLNMTVMGGSFDVPGNVYSVDEFVSPSDFVEWNFFVDPVAADKVFSTVADIAVIPLDATNMVKIDLSFVKQFSELEKTPLAEYVDQSFGMVHPAILAGQYYAWDPLAAVACIDPEVVRFKTEQVNVVTSMPHAGRLVKSASHGPGARIATFADRELFLKIFFQAFSRHTI